LDPEIVKLLPRPKLCGEPARLLTPTSPSFPRLGRISVFRKYLRIGTPRVVHLLGAVRRSKAQPLQTPIKTLFFSRYFSGQD
jgi:hypothetical protein